MRDYVRRLLEPRYDVEAVPDGEAALAAARASPPDLVLSDVMMPRLDGFGLLAALRADPRTATIPVILLSARAGEESRVEGLEAGADDYLVKPFGARELLARVHAHLEMDRLRREASRREQALLEGTRAAKERLEAVLRSISDGFIALDRDWRYVSVNDRACESMGMRREEILGRRIWDLYPDTVGTRFEAELRRAAAGRETRVFEYYYPERDRWYENRAYPSEDGLSIFFAEITERRRAEAERERLALLVENSNDFIGICDLRGAGARFNSETATRRIIARLEPAFPCRTRLRSSRKTTSRTQCSPFSMSQWPRTKPRDLRRRPCVARQVVVAGAGSLPAHLSLPVHQDHRRRVRPVGRQPHRVVDDRHVALLVPPVAVLDLLVPVGPDPVEVGLAGPVEHRLDGRPQRRLVVLDRQQVVPLLLADDPGVLDLASGRVDGHDGPGQVQRPEQLGDRGDLVRAFRHARRAEDQAVLGGPRRDHVQASRGRVLLGPRADFPSMATGISPVASHAAAIHRPNAWANDPGSSLAKTRSNVSGLGMPLSSGRNRRKNASLVRPYSAIASHDSAPPITAQVAIARMSVRRWSLFSGLATRVGQAVEHGREGHRRHRAPPEDGR